MSTDREADVHTEDTSIPDAAAGEVTITRIGLRGGGWIGYSSDALFVVEGDDRIKIPNSSVEGLALRTLEFDIAVMSLLLIGVGGWIFLNRNPLVGVAFAAVGVFSLYRTYTQRHELVIDIANEGKPVSVYPEHPRECYTTLVKQIREN